VFLNRIRPFALAVVLGLGSFLGVVQFAPLSVEAAGALPACRFDDVTTEHSSPADWQITVLDTIYRVPKSYVPSGLVSTSNAGLNGGASIRNFVIPDLRAMAKAARNAGAGLRVVSAYRSYSNQARLYQSEVQRYGEKIAKRSVARPGHSEHQLGTTIDFGSAKSSGDVSQQFAKTAAGRWMKANAWKYGWIMSYPSGKTSETCYYSEPWHYRYVGRDLAAKVHDSGLTLRQYLWYHFQ
jgi:D-alanyl-D-alanine carboxypeptidase